MKTLITVLVAITGGLVGHKMRIPAGALLGGMVAVGVYNLLGKEPYLPAEVGVAAQILVGAVIGLRINKETVLGMKEMLVPSLIIIFGVLFTSLIIGLLVYKFSDMDLITCLFSGAPGGVAEMTLAANDLGADTTKVAVLQSLRLVSVIVLIPNLLRLLTRIIK